MRLRRNRRGLRRQVFSWLLSFVVFTTLGVILVSHWLGQATSGIPFWGWGILGLVVVWGAAGAVAAHVSRPVSALVSAARELGRGNLKARVRMDRQPRGELGILADTFNDMAQRIEQQMLDQRELLAAVSHEIRSPLARIRVLTELLRGAAKSGQLDRLEAEVDGLDQLLSRLLAHSKLDFDALALCEQAPAELARQALVRGNVSADGLEVESQAPSSISLDPTLVARALDNLLENALAHGESPVGLRVGRDAATLGVRFEVFDQGPGFELETLPRVFEAFYRSDPSSGKAQSLGLGLALVQRIAQAHGGTAWAQNLPGGGACVGFSIAARRDSEPKRETR